MPDINTQDVNQDSEASTESSATEQSSQNSQESSQQQDVNQEPSLQDVVQGVLDKHKSVETSDKTTAKEEDSAVLNKNKTTSTAEGEKKNDPTAKTSPTEEDKDLANYPQRAQDRIRSLVAEKKELESFKEKATQYEPVVQRMQNIEQFCTKSNITAEDFHTAMEKLALLKTNPSEGIKALETYLTEAKQQLGQVLPPDLQQKVDDGKISMEDAKDWAKARLESKARAQQSESLVKQTQVQVQQQLTSSLKAWEVQKLTSDPDFKPKADKNGADGKYEMVMTKFGQLWQTVPVYSPAEAVALLDRAYNETYASIKSFLPTPPKRKSLSHSRSSGSQQDKQYDTKKPGWARELAHDRLGI